MNLKLFQDYITPDEVNDLPLTQYEGKIVLITSAMEVSAAVDEIKKHKVIGFDTETRPTFKKGDFYHVSLVQLAIPNLVFLFRVNKTGFSDSLVQLLADPDIQKIGVGLYDDILALKKLHDFEPSGFKELHNFVKDLGVQNTGLRKLAAIILKVRISKGQQTSNWENGNLTIKQQQYAATDAWVCLKMYDKLNQLGIIK